jgi:thioredoxin-related protein
MNKIESSLSYILLLFLAAALCSSARSQSLPPFQMVLSTGKVFKASTDLPKRGKPLILIYFDPDCDHCQKLMKDLFKKINNFKKAEIVMVTFKSITELVTFEKKYSTHNYTNIITGTEGSFFYLRNYYQLVKMPFIALYDQNRNLRYSYRQETPVDDLIKRLKNLK